MTAEDMFPPKVRTFGNREELLAKLGGKAKLWFRTAADADARAKEFDSAMRKVLAGATTVTVGRTTYVIDGTDAAETPEPAAGEVTDS